MSLEQFAQFIKLLVGKDQLWRKRWKLETEEGREKLEEEYLNRGLGFSGVMGKKLKSYEEKRAAEFKDKERERLLEGLGVIPPWLSLLIATAALLITLLK